METIKIKVYGKEFKNDYQRACRFYESSDVIKKMGTTKHDVYNITDGKMSPRGSIRDARCSSVVALAREFSQDETIRKMCEDAGGIFISKADLEDIDLEQQIQAIAKMNVLLGIANKLKG